MPALSEAWIELNSRKKHTAVPSVSHAGPQQERHKRGSLDWEQVSGKWQQYKGKAKEKWGELTDNELDLVAGKRDQIVGKLQEKYGYTKERAEKEAEKWKDMLQ